MTLPPYPRALMNPVTTDFLSRISAVKRADDIPAGDLIEMARMFLAGDLVYVDAIPAWLAAQEQAILRDEMVDACRTPEANGWPV